MSPTGSSELAPGATPDGVTPDGAAARAPGQAVNDATGARVRGRTVAPYRHALDSTTNRLRAALVKLHRHPDPVVQAEGKRVGAAAVAALEALVDEAELAHPITRQRRQRLERLEQRVAQARRRADGATTSRPQPPEPPRDLRG